MSNDCWPKIKKTFSWWLKMWIRILNFLLDILTPYFIQANCSKHDKWYTEWWNEKRRLECDLKFHYYICRDIDDGNYNIFKRIYLYILASAFYIAVRVWGEKHFNYL